MSNIKFIPREHKIIKGIYDVVLNGAKLGEIQLSLSSGRWCFSAHLPKVDDWMILNNLLQIHDKLAELNSELTTVTKTV